MNRCTEPTVNPQLAEHTVTTIRLRKYLRTHADWLIILVGAAFLLALAGAIALTVSDKETADPPSTVPRSAQPQLPPLEPLDPKYPSPALEQRALSTFYTEGALQYTVTWTNRNIPRNPAIGGHIFTFELYNSANKDVVLDSATLDAVTIGCIAMDGPYRKVPVTVKPLQFTPYEKKTTQVTIDVACLYLGSADGKYFWRIY